MKLNEIYYCNHCQELMDNPIVKEEKDIGGESLLCNWCQSQDLSSYGQCLICKTWQFWNEPIDYFICDGCADALTQRFQMLLTSNFSDFERERLNEIFEGNYF